LFSFAPADDDRVVVVVDWEKRKALRGAFCAGSRQTVVADVLIKLLNYRPMNSVAYEY